MEWPSSVLFSPPCCPALPPLTSTLCDPRRRRGSACWTLSLRPVSGGSGQAHVYIHVLNESQLLSYLYKYCYCMPITVWPEMVVGKLILRIAFFLDSANLQYFYRHTHMCSQRHVIAAFSPSSSLPAPGSSLAPEALREANERVAGLTTEAEDAGPKPNCKH